MKPINKQIRETEHDIAAQAEHVADLHYEFKKQHPQPNGYKYLHGEPITKFRVCDAEYTLWTLCRELNRLLTTKKMIEYIEQ